MKTTEFCYWLQGLFELQPDTVTKGLTPQQTDLIKRHLALVFHHDIDPSYSTDPKKQQELNNIHSGKPPFGGKPLIRC